MVVAADDHLALEAYQLAREPKKLVLLPGGHFDAYVKDFDAASEAAAPRLVPGAPRLELDRRWLSLP